MDDIDSYYTDRPVCARPPLGNRSYPPPRMMRMDSPGKGPLPRAQQSQHVDQMSPSGNMMPAPLRTRRSPPPGSMPPPPPRQASHHMRTSPKIGQLRPLDSIGAPKMRAPSPSPRPLDSIGVPRPPRSTSTRPLLISRSPSPNFLAPQLDCPTRTRSASVNDRYEPEHPSTRLFTPAKDNDLLPSTVYRPNSPLPALPRDDSILPSTTYRAASPQPAPSQQANPTPQGQKSYKDIMLSSDFFEEIVVGPYQDLDRPPPPPRKNSVKPSIQQMILTPKVPSIPGKPALSSTSEEDRLRSDRGLRSMWLGDIQAGPYAQEDENMSPMPSLPARSWSKSPPVHTPDMSEPGSDNEDSITSRFPLPGSLSGLRITTEPEDLATLPATTYSPYTLPSSAYSPGEEKSLANIVKTTIKIDESSPIAEVKSDLLEPARTPRKSIPSMHEYMSMDQLEAMWGAQDQMGGGLFSIDMVPVTLGIEDTGRHLRG